MADLLIKNMELPKNCGCCDMCILGKDKQNFFCTRQIGKRFHWTLAEQRQEGCPLVEVKPHGDLIDRDKLLKLDNITFIDYGHWMADYEAVKTSVIENAPVILEASKED